MKKLFTSILALMIIGSAWAAEAAGSTGGCTWSLIGNTLTISPNSGVLSSVMPDYLDPTDSPWYRNMDIKTVIIEMGVTRIGQSAFYFCQNVTSVSIPNTVTSIGRMAFVGCAELSSITLPDGLMSIGEAAFLGCNELPSISIPASVVQIDGRAFAGCRGLTSITVPTGVTSIGYGAFLHCTGLTSIIVEAGNTYYDSRNDCNALFETSSNTLLCGCQTTVIPNTVTTIGDAAFKACHLTGITIPSNVMSIGEEAFYDCYNLTSITIPVGVTSIGRAAFARCSELMSITVEDGNTWYDSRNDCNALIETSTNTLLCGCQNTIIPNTVTSIDDEAFNSCPMTSITIPASVTSIGELAFFECFELTEITCEAVIPPTCNDEEGLGSFEDTPTDIPVYVPVAGLSAYRAAAEWSEFEKISPMLSANVDPANAGVYYSTFYDSSVKYELPAGVEAYVATVDGERLNLTKIAEAGQTIPDDNAVILKSTVQNYTLTVSDAAAVSVGSNDLQGVDAATMYNAVPGWSAGCTVYVLSGKSADNTVTGVGFYTYTGTLKAHRAYAIVGGSGAGAPRRLPFVFNETNIATGIENSGESNESSQSSVSVQKVIRNGQLIIIRDGKEYNAQGQIIK